MIPYIFYCILDILFTLVCYLTNPIVVLFADECGELPHSLRYWQTWDNPLDIDWMVYEHHVPKFAEYDFNKHYTYTNEWDAEEVIGKHKGFVTIKDPNFSLYERFQRYVCRCTWLYRNTGYGFSYEVTGRDIDGAKVITVTDVKNAEKNEYWGHYKNLLTEPFCYKLSKKRNKKYSWKVFLGWKFQRIKSTESGHYMLVLDINPFK